jgi:hypothetical protein
MQLKYTIRIQGEYVKLRAISVLAGAAAITAAAITGVTVSPAMAATPTQGNSDLCIATTSYCIYAPGDDNLSSTYGVIMSPGAHSEWLYPELNGGAQTIEEPLGGPCLGDGIGHDVITADTFCAGGGGELWTNFYNAITKHTEFVLYHVLTSNGSNLCLSFDESGTDIPGNTTPNILRADPCTLGSSPSTYWYQQWTG